MRREPLRADVGVVCSVCVYLVYNLCVLEGRTWEQGSACQSHLIKHVMFVTEPPFLPPASAPRPPCIKPVLISWITLTHFAATMDILDRSVSDLFASLSLSDIEQASSHCTSFSNSLTFPVPNNGSGWDDSDAESEDYWTADELPSQRLRVNSLRRPNGKYFYLFISLDVSHSDCDRRTEGVVQTGPSKALWRES